jgi:4a-hydroxytetrahydrobiopterin dehydratase
MFIEKMSMEEVHAGLEKLSGWELKDQKLYRQLKFKNFGQAFGFMTQAAIIAEKINHHPEWSNVYNRVTIFLTTHEAGGISQQDFELAQQINEVLAGMAL